MRVRRVLLCKRAIFSAERNAARVLFCEREGQWEGVTCDRGFSTGDLLALCVYLKKGVSKMKKILMSLVLMPLMVLAATWTDPDTGIIWTYIVSDDTAKIGSELDGVTAIPSATTGAITIPSTLGGYRVTSIGDYAFSYCSKLTSVVIQEGVTTIGDNAFSGCSGLTSVIIPFGVTNIGKHAFRYCYGLTSVTIPSSVTSIGIDLRVTENSVSCSPYSAFDGCTGLESVTIPACAVVLRYAFPSAYTKIRDVVVCEGVTSIGYTAFQGCSELKSVNLPSSVTSIGMSAFEGCSELKSVNLPSSVTSIGTDAFSGCSGL